MKVPGGLGLQGLGIEGNIQTHQKLLQSFWIPEVNLDFARDIKRLTLGVFQLEGQQNPPCAVEMRGLNIDPNVMTDLMASIA